MNIKKIIREEIEDDFGWVRDIPPFKGGDSIPENEICFDGGDDCKVNINKDNITFRVTLDNDFYDEYFSYDDEWIVSDLFQTSMYGGGYDGDGDYYEFDGEEFNYTGYHLDDDLRERIVDFWLKINEEELKEDLEGFFGDYMLSFGNYLKSPILDAEFDVLVNNVLSALGYAVQEARWIITSNEFYSEIEKLRNAGIGMELDRRWGLNDLIVTIPMEIVNEIHREEHFLILETLLSRVLRPLISISWYDWFHEEWDSSGATDRIVQAWEDFLEFGEKFIKTEEYEEEKNLIDMFYEKFNSEGWRLDHEGGNWLSIKFEKPSKNPLNSKWALNVSNVRGFLTYPDRAKLGADISNSQKNRWLNRVRFEVGPETGHSLKTPKSKAVETRLDEFFKELDKAMREYNIKFF